MKMNLNRWRLGLCVLGLAAGTALLVAERSSSHYTAHEWGTFTSVQGGDGVLLQWRPLESSKLPGFVYDWTKAGLNRQPPVQMLLRKGAVQALQRMETPVIYFYAEEEQSVDVSVMFPKGTITEWFPQASQIGPSTMPTQPAIAKLDDFAHKAGLSPAFTFASLFGSLEIKESRARWANVRLLAAKQNDVSQNSLPMDRSGSHYFSARDTDANILRVSSLVATNPAAEHEKFIFYRGVGSFATPLQTRMDSDKSLILANTGPEGLAHLFVLGVANGRGKFIAIDRLASGKTEQVEMDLTANPTPLEQLSKDLGKKMAAALVSQGLYEREAVAMVNTWKDSWFAEEGLRVLYVLPRGWTDETLPLKLQPAPRELVRVMVGRAEVIPLELQRQLTDALVKGGHGDVEAQQEAVALFKKLGRFAEPALQLATSTSSKEVQQTAWSLFVTATQPATKSL